MPYEDDDEEYNPKKPKVSTKESYLDKLPKRPPKEKFLENVQEIESKKTKDQEEIAELTKKYFDILKDKTLVENRTTSQESYRKEIIEKLINFAVNINNDEMQESEGMGSISLILLLLRTNMGLKDFANKLEFKIEELNKKLALLENNKDVR